MAEQNDPVLTDVMELLEIESTNAPADLPMAGPDIPALREELAILVCMGKCKEAIGVSFSQDQVKRLDDKYVLKYYKRYEIYVGRKTTKTLIDGFLYLATKALGMVVKIKDAEVLKNDLKADYIISNQISQLSGGISLRCGRMLAVVNALLITSLKHVDFSSDEVIPEQITEQSSEITQELVSNTE